MLQGPGMDCVTVSVQLQDNASNITNGSDVTPTNLAGATIASPISMFLAGVIGNILALLVLQRTRRESQRLMFHGLVAGLVWNDLIGIVLTSPVTIVSYINGLQMPGGEHLCRFNGFVMVCFGISTPLIVSAMAIERFLFVRYTFFYTKHCAPGAARMVVVVIWAFVLFFGLLPLFGFGSYVLQYPRTWCFLDFRATDPIHVSYGYIYALLNMLLVLVMVVCNLVVVATLARVRDFRRKHSTSSLNSVLIGDNVLDETAKVQAIARRRKQKDIELHMIVVMCAITTIFAVCWVPLMIYIMMSLASVCNTDHVLGLVAIRMASLNQTLNPWLYVILRRSLIIRLKKYCCQWKRCLRKKKSSAHLHPAGRRQQYVHVRNQLCHRNNFVGGLDGMGSEAMSDSMRQSLQKAIPGALSLPDVMMVNTGRRELDLPYSDIAKAQSFAGRVSHSYSPGSLVFCAYCEAPSINIDVCSECIRNRQKERETSLNLPDRRNASKISGQNRELQAENSARDEKTDLRHRNGRIRYVNKPSSVEDMDTNMDCDKSHNEDSVGGLVMSCGRETNGHTDGHRDNTKPNRELTGGALQSSIRSSSTHSRANSKGFDPRPSQHSATAHKPPHGSKSSASVKSSKSSSLSKSRPSSLHSASHDTATHSSSDGPSRRWTRTESGKCTSPNDYNDVFLNDSKEGDEHLCVFHDEDDDGTFDEDHRDTTTDDDGMFSFPPTESIYLSESTNSQTSKQINGNTKKDTSTPVSPKAYLNNREDATSQYIRNNKSDSLKGKTKSLDNGSNFSPAHEKPAHVTNGNDLNAVPPTTSAATLSTQCVNVKPEKTGYLNSRSYMNPGFDRFSSDSSSLVRDNSDDEGSSGIFSAESPAHVSRRSVDIPFFKKESHSDAAPANKTTAIVKEQARKVKSYH